MSEPFAQRNRRLKCCDCLLIQIITQIRLLPDTNTKFPRRHSDTVDEQVRLGRGCVKRTRFKRICQIKHHCGIANRARQHMMADHSAPVFCRNRTAWDTPARRTQPEKPATRCRDTDRACSVIAIGHRHHTRGNGRCRTAGRTANAACHIPGIECRTMKRGFRCDIAGKLRQIGFTHHHQTSGLIAFDEFMIALRDISLCRTTSKRHCCTGIGRAIILQQNRNTAERALWQRFKLFFRLIAHLVDHSIQLGIAPINRCKCLMNSLTRRQNFCANGLSQTDSVGPGVVKGCRRHGVIPMLSS